MTYPRYEARSLTVVRRKDQSIGPKSPCGIAIPPGFILDDDGNYVRENDYLSHHTLDFYRRRVA